MRTWFAVLMLVAVTQVQGSEPTNLAVAYVPTNYVSEPSLYAELYISNATTGSPYAATGSLWSAQAGLTNAILEYSEYPIITLHTGKLDVIVDRHATANTVAMSDSNTVITLRISAAHDVITGLAAQGVICEVLGHMWRPGRPGETPTQTFADYHPNTWFRTCKICGRSESQHMTEWK